MIVMSGLSVLKQVALEITSIIIISYQIKNKLELPRATIIHYHYCLSKTEGDEINSWLRHSVSHIISMIAMPPVIDLKAIEKSGWSKDSVTLGVGS